MNDRNIITDSAGGRTLRWLANLWYDFVWALTFGLVILAFSLRMRGRHHVPKNGAVLILANHQSFLDPPFIGMAISRRLTFLARKTLFRNRLFGAIIGSLKSVPVDQEGIAKEGLKAILAQLELGAAVLVFPEGERTWGGEMLPFKPGVQLLIKRAKATVIPVGVAGAFQALPRTRKTLRLSPLFLPPTEARAAVSVGKPLDGARLAALPREQLLSELFLAVKNEVEQAEKLRRK